MSSIFTGTKHLVGQNECLDWLKIIRFNCSTIQINYRKIDYFKHRCALADLGGARPARAPPFAWHPSSLADLGGACPVRTPAICLAS